MSNENPNEPTFQSLNAGGEPGREYAAEMAPADLETATEQAIQANTAALRTYAERPGIGSENYRKVSEHIAKVTGIIRDNPDRVAYDASKSIHQRTVHDPNLAHLEAWTVDGNMTRLAKDDARRKQGKGLGVLRTAGAQQRDMLASRLGANLAEQEYDADPIDAGPGAIMRDLDAARKNPSYKHIKHGPDPYKK